MDSDRIGRLFRSIPERSEPRPTLALNLLRFAVGTVQTGSVVCGPFSADLRRRTRAGDSIVEQPR